MQMDGPALLAVCKQHRLYQTPALNDKLYAHFKGFTALGALEPYTGLRALFLEGNALASTDGLPPLPELRCLFLQQNMLTSLSPSVAALPLLDTLNLSGNALQDLSGLAGCAALRTLLVADNQLASNAAVAPLAACPALESLDLQNNHLEDGPGLLELLAQLQFLKCLYLRGNPLVSSMRSYRKTVISALPGLTYLDDRPVFELERVCAEAWARGGVEAEREARAAFHERNMEAEKRRVEALREIREAGWRKRREALGLPLEGGDPDLEGLPADWQPVEDGQQEEEPEELRAARSRLAAFTAAKKRQEAGQEDEQLPDLAKADAHVLLEERRANQAALMADAAMDASPTGASAAPPVGSPVTGAQCTAAPAMDAGGVPEAAVTVHVQDGSCTTVQPEACPGADCESMGGAGGQRCMGGAGTAASNDGADSDDEDSDSVAAFSLEDGDDWLAELD